MDSADHSRRCEQGWGRPGDCIHGFRVNSCPHNPVLRLGDNARDWKDLTPRRRSGPFLRLRDKRGDFIR